MPCHGRWIWQKRCFEFSTFSGTEARLILAMWPYKHILLLTTGTDPLIHLEHFYQKIACQTAAFLHCGCVFPPPGDRRKFYIFIDSWSIPAIYYPKTRKTLQKNTGAAFSPKLFISSSFCTVQTFTLISPSQKNVCDKYLQSKGKMSHFLLSPWKCGKFPGRTQQVS